MNASPRFPRLRLGENVHIVYIDDSKQDKLKDCYQLIGAVIVNDEIFDTLEQHLAYHLYELVEAHATGPIEELHACDLLAGHPPFDKITRAHAIEILSHAVDAVNDMSIPVIYGAVNLSKFRTTIYGGGSAVDIAFRMCVQSVEEWLSTNSPNGLGLLISDDCDKPVKYAMLNSFHLFRNRACRSPLCRGILEHLHDDMYFGDSKFSKGIQLADICTLLIGRHLAGYSDTEDLYKQLSKSIVKCSLVPSPEAQ